jgi:lysophospholipase L1-like esterase
MKKVCIFLLIILAIIALAFSPGNPKPKVIIIGDSTVKNGKGEGANGKWGWGDQIACFFDTARIDVVNHAIGGRSSRTFITEGRWDTTLKRLNAGDYLLIQFGHNDASEINDTSRARGTIKGISEDSIEIDNMLTGKHEVVYTYGYYMRKYVRDAKAKGVRPIIVSLIPRNKFEERGRMARDVSTYAGWAKQVAEAENVPFIDLNQRSATALERIASGNRRYILDSTYYKGDNTHTSLIGAKLNAALVAKAIDKLDNCELYRYLLTKTYNSKSANATKDFEIEKIEENGIQKGLVISTTLPEGNYDVSLSFGCKDKKCSTTVRGESRRLFLQNVETKKGVFSEQSFTVNVRNSHINKQRDVRLKPRENGKLNWDDKLTIELNGENIDLQSINVRPNPNAQTIFICGNSTVVDQDNEPYCGWGQMFTSFFGFGISIANYAESGESASSFLGEGRLDKLFTQAKAGDYIFIEFGHNDQKQKGEGKGAWLSFTDELKTFIVEARKRGLNPVLLTPVQRRNFSADTVANTHEDYPAAIRKLAAAEKVPLIDLAKQTRKLYEAWGEEQSVKAFVHYKAGDFPGLKEDVKDNTHFNNFGGYEVAKCVVEGIKTLKFNEITRYLRPEYLPFDPSKPDNPEKFLLPQSPYMDLTKPEGD